MTASIHHLPLTARERARAACRRPVAAHPQSNAFGFPPVDALPVDLDGTRVLIRGRRAKTFLTETNAVRSAELLTELNKLGWPIHLMTEEA